MYPVGIVQHPSCFCHGADHQGIPGGEYLVVEQRADALTADRKQLVTGYFQFGLEIGFLHAHFFGDGFRPSGNVENIFPLKIPSLGNVVIVNRHACCFPSQNLFDFLLGPHIELAFHPFAVRIFGAEESSFCRSHVPVDILQKIVGKISKLFLAGDLIGFDQGGGEQGVVIEHFFEMWHQPFVIRAVTGKASSDLVINSPELHGLERVFRHRQAVGVAGAVVMPEQER